MTRSPHRLLSTAALAVMLAFASCSVGSHPRETLFDTELNAVQGQPCGAHEEPRYGTSESESAYRAFQKVNWVEGSINLVYSATVEGYPDGTVRIFLRVKNLSTSTVLILSDARWRTAYQGQIVHLVHGDIVGNYGNEVPALQELRPADCISEIGELTIDFDRGPFTHLVTGFHGIFHVEATLLDELNELPEVNGWWQLSDLELTEQYYTSMSYPMIAFSLPGSSPLRGEP